ncbi:putative kinase, partial [Lachnellula suecica]
MASPTSAPQNPELSSNPTSHAAPPPSAILDDKSPHCIPFILSRLHTYRSSQPKDSVRPFVIGLNGVQGAGKTTLVSVLAETLREKEGLETLVLSIDDLYLKREDQVQLAREQEGNMLVQFRGEPGTHDIPLARTLISSLLSAHETSIPSYTKSAHNGLGDRAQSSSFKTVNGPSQPKISVVILEGWCVGFRALPPSVIAAKQAAPSLTLSKHALSHLEFVNEKLKEYDVLTDEFDAFIHIDAQDTRWVYGWREEQEKALREKGQGGMSEEQVVRFVDVYFPAYELYVEGVRWGH